MAYKNVPYEALKISEDRETEPDNEYDRSIKPQRWPKLNKTYASAMRWKEINLRK